MKHFCDLTSDQQEKAIKFFTDRLAFSIGAGAIRFDDSLNSDDLQTRIDKIRQEADRLNTPWFFVEMMLKDEYIAERLKELATQDAQDAFYLESYEQFMQLNSLK